MWKCPPPHLRVGASSAPIWALNPSLLSPDFPGPLLLFSGAFDNAQDRVRIPVGPGSHSTKSWGSCVHTIVTRHWATATCSSLLSIVRHFTGHYLCQDGALGTQGRRGSILCSQLDRRKGNRSLGDGSADFFCRGSQ